MATEYSRHLRAMSPLRASETGPAHDVSVGTPMWLAGEALAADFGEMKV